MSRIKDIKITTYEDYALLCRTFLSDIDMESLNTKSLHRFVQEMNFRVIDHIASGGELKDYYIESMVKKAQFLFNDVLTDNDKARYNSLSR